MTTSSVNQPSAAKLFVYVQIIAICIFSVLFLVFGANKFLGFLDLSFPPDPIAKAFLTAMFTSYLVKLVGFFQVIGAILLLIPKFRFMGTLIFMPIILNIMVFHLAHDNPGNKLWILVTILYIIICLTQKDGFQSLIRISGGQNKTDSSK